MSGFDGQSSITENVCLEKCILIAVTSYLSGSVNKTAASNLLEDNRYEWRICHVCFTKLD